MDKGKRIMCRSLIAAGCLALLCACNSQSDQSSVSAGSGQDLSADEMSQGCRGSVLTREGFSKLSPNTLKDEGEDQLKLELVIDQALQTACRDGLINKTSGLTDKSGKTLSAFLIHNAPNANFTSIYAQGDYAVLESPFFQPGSEKVLLPTVDAVKEAIYCYVKGPTNEEVETEGRCLPD